MPGYAEKTRCDALRTYLTGAVVDGGAQPNPAAALGGYRSSTEAQSMAITVTNPINGINILFAGGGNAVGDGTLVTVGVSGLQWQCAGGEPGPVVQVANGETKILETADNPAAYIRISRTTSNDLSGTATVGLAVTFDNLFGLADALDAEAAVGSTKYRAMVIVNAAVSAVLFFKKWLATLGVRQTANAGQLGASGAGTIATTGTFATWPAKGWVHIKNSGTTREIAYYSARTTTTLTIPAAGRGRLGTSAAAGANTDTLDAVPGMAIGLDPAGVVAGGSTTQTIADENTAPTGVGWVVGNDPAHGLNVGVVLPGKQVTVWVKRELPAGAGATTEGIAVIQDSFDFAA